MADLTIGGNTFRVEVEGDATRPSLILSHALGTDLTMWDAQVPPLARHFRVIRYDQRGHGGSAGGDAPISIARLGRDALAIMDALEIEKAHWLGLSMGGAVGLWLLANAPDRIDRAVLANTAPRLGTPDMWNARIGAVLAGGMAETAAAAMTRWFGPDFARVGARRVASIEAILTRTSPQAYAGCCAALRDMDLRTTLDRIDHDVLVVSSRNDPVVSGDETSAFVERLPHARHVSLDARHLSNIEAEAAFNAAVVSFLTTKLTPRRHPAAKGRPVRRPRKATASKAPVKRGHTTRRSNAARSPIKKTTAKRSTQKAPGPVRPAPKKKATTASRRQEARSMTVNRPTPKSATKTRPGKDARKALKVTTRRPTPTTTARGTIVKKAKPTKTVAKTTTKKAAAKSLKKSPVRRRTTGKSRRPTGRRTP